MKFIEKNTSGVNIGTGGEDYVDPYTGNIVKQRLILLIGVPGASRYRSAGSSASSGPTSSYMDPYTGASRYSGAPQAAAPTAPNPSYMDPFTGASRYSGAPEPPPPVAKIIPVVSCYKYLFSALFNSETQGKCIAFKQASVSAMQGKLHQFNEALQNEIVRSSYTFPLRIADVR